MSMSVLRAMQEALDTGRPFVVANIIAQAGSTPRTAGARMVVFADGTSRGTVGGGRPEADAAALAASMLREVAAGAAPDRMLRVSLAGVTDMDMICGGSFSLLLEAVLPGTAKAALAGETCRQIAARRSFCRLTAISPEPGGHDGTEPCRTRSFLFSPETGIAPPPGSPGAEGPAPHYAPDQTPDENLARAACEALIAKAEPFLHGDPGAQWFVEPFFPEPAAYIFGAGHVAVETAAIAARAGFQVTVIDDRPEFADAERFPAAYPVVLADLGEDTVAGFLAEHAPGPGDAIIIITRGHAHDRTVLAAALNCGEGGGAGYVGMIGSRSKRDGIYEALKKRGFAAERLAAVRSPIGLSIGAETPAEIAVSIVAELIEWRRAGR